MIRLDTEVAAPPSRLGPLVAVRVVRVEQDSTVFEIAGRQVRGKTDSTVTAGQRFLARVAPGRGQLSEQRATGPETGARSLAKPTVGVTIAVSRDSGVDLQGPLTRTLVLLASLTPHAGSDTGPVSALVAALTTLIANPARVHEIRRALHRLVEQAAGGAGGTEGAGTPRLLSVISRLLAAIPTDLNQETRAELERSLRDLQQPLRDAAQFRVEEDEAEMRVVLPLGSDDRPRGSARVRFRFEGRPRERASPRPLSFDIAVQPEGQERTSVHGEARDNRLAARFVVSGEQALAVAHAGLEPLASRLRQLGFADVELSAGLRVKATVPTRAEGTLNVVG